MEAENVEIIIIDNEEGLKDYGEEASAKYYSENEALEESSDSNVEDVFQVVPHTFIS